MSHQVDAMQQADMLKMLEGPGELLLGLYQSACRLPLVEFQALAMKTLQSVLPFDSAWWGLATRVDTRMYLHFSFRHRLPEITEELVNISAGDNVVARSCGSDIGTTYNFGPGDLFSNVATGMPAQFMGIQHLLCTQILDRPPNTWNVVALMRSDTSSSFSEQERRLKQRLMPHLTQMMQINRYAQLALLRSQAEASSSFAGIVDAHDIVHTYEPGFENLLRLEWPEWDGVLLPQPAQSALHQGKHHYAGKRLAVHFGTAGEQTLVTLTRRSKLDQLSPREQLIAKEFAEGCSYKLVAKRLETSPATVRNHLRSIYQKLEISNKAELTRLYAGRS